MSSEEEDDDCFIDDRISGEIIDLIWYGVNKEIFYKVPLSLDYRVDTILEEIIENKVEDSVIDIRFKLHVYLQTYLYDA